MIKHEIRLKNGGIKVVSLTPLKAIRFQCIEFMGFSAFEVKKCTSPLCSLFSYRLGTNPERKGNGNNAYGARMNLFLGKSEIVKGEGCKIVVPPHIKKRCKCAIGAIKGNDIFYIPKVHGVENPRIDIKILMPLTFIAHILKESYDKPKMLSQIYRCAFATGLEIVCNWIIQGTIPEDEYNFCKILHNIL